MDESITSSNNKFLNNLPSTKTKNSTIKPFNFTDIPSDVPSIKTKKNTKVTFNFEQDNEIIAKSLQIIPNPEII